MKLSTKYYFGAWTAIAQQGCQSFQIGPDCDTKEEARFFVKMFRIALKNHNRATGKAAFNRVAMGGK